MSDLITLDAGPVGLLCQRPGLPIADRCRTWARDVESGGSRVIIPEIAVYETRRELIRIGSASGLRRLDELKVLFEYLPITTEAMDAAAALWAAVRQAGIPTAHPQALDGDCILAAQAVTLARPGDVVVIATSNVGHLARFPGVDARPWESIT